jgi:hypothetical protein
LNLNAGEQFKFREDYTMMPTTTTITATTPAMTEVGILLSGGSATDEYEYNLISSEFDYSELIELHHQLVDTAASISERSELWSVTVWEKRRQSYRQTLDELNSAIAAVSCRIEQLEKEAVACGGNKVEPSSSGGEIAGEGGEAPCQAPCWWFGCEVLVEPDETHCEKHRLLSAELALDAQAVA